MVKNKYFLFGLFLFLISDFVQSQVYGGFANQYFQNKYLLNPAYVGTDENGLALWMNYRSNNTDIEGKPQTFAITADMPFKNFGIGTLFSSDQSGNFSAVKFLGSMSYVVKFKRTKFLKMGLSAGYYKERLLTNNITDLSVIPSNSKIADYSNRSGMFDGNAGIVLVYNNFDIGVGLPNFKAFQGSSLDFSICNGFFSYKLESQSVNLTPIAYYQLFKQGKQVLDLGGQVELLNKLFLMGMFNTSVRGTLVGLGYNHINNFKISFYYSVSTDVAVNNFGGAFEIGVSLYPKALLAKRYAEEEDN